MPKRRQISRRNKQNKKKKKNENHKKKVNKKNKSKEKQQNSKVRSDLKQISNKQANNEDAFVRDNYNMDGIQIISSPSNEDHSTIALSVYNTLKQILNQKDVHDRIYRALNFIAQHSSQKELQFVLDKGYPSDALPSSLSSETIKRQVPLGGCKLISSVVGCLCSPFEIELKRRHRFQGRELKEIRANIPSNAKQNLLLIEYKKGVKCCMHSSSKSVLLQVSITDLYAKKKPLLTGFGHDGHFDHCFSLIITKSKEKQEEKQNDYDQKTKDDGVEMWVYSSYARYNIKEWMNDHYKCLKNPREFIEKFNGIENAKIWDDKIDRDWFKLFGYHLPRLVKHKWPIQSYLTIIVNTFDENDVKTSAKLF